VCASGLGAEDLLQSYYPRIAVTVDMIAINNTDPEIMSSIASRLTRLDRQIDDSRRRAPTELAGGPSIRDIAYGIVEALGPDRQVELARVEPLPTGIRLCTVTSSRGVSQTNSTVAGNQCSPWIFLSPLGLETVGNHPATMWPTFSHVDVPGVTVRLS
jgi:hypothetical protein